MSFGSPLTVGLRHAVWLAGALVLALLGSGCAVARPGRAAITRAVPAAADPAFTAFLERNLNAPFSRENTVRELVNGEVFYPAMLDAIRNAREDIRFEMYLMESGRVMDEFINALTDRTRAGVRVRMLVDWLGCRALEPRDRDRLCAAGIQLRSFHPGWFQRPARLNHRNHRKLILTDNTVGFVGGAGVADRWYGDARHPGEWRDSMFEIRGPVLHDLAVAFERQWARLGGGAQPVVLEPADAQGPGDAAVLWLGDGGGDLEDTLFQSYLYAVRAARQRLRIGVAYFVPNRELLEAIVDARRRGVEVELLLPHDHMDSWPVNPASRRSWGTLLKTGVRIYQYRPSMYHCKVLIVDDAWTVVGSANFDNRSMRLNEELILHVASRAFAGEALRQFDRDRQEAAELTLEVWRSRSLARRLAECLIWPLVRML